MYKKKIISPSKNFRIINLLQNAYIRWKEKFIGFLQTSIIFFLIWIAINAGIIVIFGILSLIVFLFLKNYFFVILVSELGVFTSFIISIYILAFFILSTVNLIIKENVGIFSSMRSVQRFVPRYIWVGIISLIFLSGFFLFGLMSFFVITILWSFWSSFTTFVYLEKKEKGLKNLWISKTMYDQNYQILIPRSLILLGLSLFISIPHILAAWTVGKYNLIYYFIYFLSYGLNFIFMPYQISFNYELYKNLEKPHVVKTSKIWISISLLGWILNLLLIVLFSFVIWKIIPIIKQNYSYNFNIQTNKSQVYKSDAIYYNTMINQPVITPDYTFTLESVKKVFSKDDSEELDKTEQLILANVSIENNSQDIFNYSSYDFFIKNSNNLLQGPVFSFMVNDRDMLGSGKLYPGAQKIGVIAFKVKVSDAPFVLLYKPYSSSHKFAIKAKI